MSTLTRKSPRQSLQLKACPRCGGDVCRMRDTFGVYHRCAQCGREIRATLASATPAMTAAAPAQMPAPAASVASIASPAAASAATAPVAAGVPAQDSGEAGIASIASAATAVAANMTVPAATIAGIVAATPSHHPAAADRAGKLLL